MSRLTLLVSTAVLLVMGSVAPAFAGDVALTLTGCSAIPTMVNSTDTPNGFTVTGSLVVSALPVVPGVDVPGSCSVEWREQRTIGDAAGMPTTVLVGLQLGLDLPPDYSSLILVSASTTHVIEANNPAIGQDAFAAILSIITSTGAGNSVTDENSKSFIDPGGHDTLEQDFSFNLLSAPPPSFTLNFTVTSETITPEPATGVLLFAGFAALAVRARRRR